MRLNLQLWEGSILCECRWPPAHWHLPWLSIWPLRHSLCRAPSCTQQPRSEQSCRLSKADTTVVSLPFVLSKAWKLNCANQSVGSTGGSKVEWMSYFKYPHCQETRLVIFVEYCVGVIMMFTDMWFWSLVDTWNGSYFKILQLERAKWWISTGVCATTWHLWLSGMRQWNGSELSFEFSSAATSPENLVLNSTSPQQGSRWEPWVTTWMGGIGRELPSLWQDFASVTNKFLNIKPLR